MEDDYVRVPAGWYPDPLGLPQLRWWDNHAWTEHISDARQPMTATEVVTTKLAYADDDFYDDRSSADGEFGEHDLSRRERRERERLAGTSRDEADAGDRQPTSSAPAFAEPLRSLEAPERDQISLEEPSPAVRLATTGTQQDAPTSAPFDLDTRFDDLLGEASVPRSAFAHVGESASSYIPVTPTEPQSAPSATAASADGTHQRVVIEIPTSTGPAWIMAMTPLWVLVAGLLLLLSGANLGTPVTVGVMFGVPYVVGIVLAVVDYVQLRHAGMERPAIWLWAFLTLVVYLIARLTRTVRETGTGFGPILTFMSLGISLVVATAAVPGLIIEIDPASFSHQAEVSIEQSAAGLGTELTAKCPPTPPLIPQQSFVCQAHKRGHAMYDVTVSLQRSNGWIDWRVDDWGVFSAN